MESLYPIKISSFAGFSVSSIPTVQLKMGGLCSAPVFANAMNMDVFCGNAEPEEVQVMKNTHFYFHKVVYYLSLSLT